jgi:hypothetical protein
MELRQYRDEVQETFWKSLTTYADELPSDFRIFREISRQYRPPKAPGVKLRLANDRSQSGSTHQEFWHDIISILLLNISAIFPPWKIESV